MKKSNAQKVRQAKPRPRISKFARRLWEAWKELGLPISGSTVVVAVSGGSDSMALLLGIDELLASEKLSVNLIVAHLDHGLRSESKQDAEWVQKVVKGLGYSTVVGKANLTIQKANLEQTARNARYRFLQRTAARKGASLVVTGHTLDDQAETILMRLLRGSAAEGLSGASATRSLEQNSKVTLARPLLSWARREDTVEYCRQRNITFRVDRMNDDEAFSRVRVRKQLLPLMKSFNNRIVETLSRTASLLSEDATALAAEASRLLQLAETSAENSETESSSLTVSVLLQSPAAVRRRVLREWIRRSQGDLRRVEMVHLQAVDGLLKGEKGGRTVELPGGMKITRQRGRLLVSSKKRLKKKTVTSRIPRR